MKKILFYILIVFLLSSCSKYHIKKEINESSNLSKIKKSGILFRIPKGSMIEIDNYYESLDFWLEGYKKNNDLSPISDISENISKYPNAYKRIYQTSSYNKFLKYKSTGVLSIFTRNNEEELKKIITDNELDSLIIYEIDSGFSIEMQFIDFNSLVTIVDQNFKIIYMDHQKDMFEVDEMDPLKVKKHLLDSICQRFLKVMTKLKYVEEIK